MSKQARYLYEFGPFRLDAAERLLLRDGQPVPLTPKAFDTLLALVENSGHVIEKDELMEKVWPDAIVEESTLAQNVFTLRKALGEGRSGDHYIETVPKHGYRFVAAVRESNVDAPALIVEKHTRSRVVTEEEEQIVAEPHEQSALAATAKSLSRRRLRTRAVLVGALLLLAVSAAALLYLWRSKTREVPVPTAVRVIAVLPFKPISTEGRDETLELGMADALITKLSAISQIVVRSTNSVRKYTALEQDPVAAGRELRVESVLEGNVQRVGDRIRVTARFVSVEDGRAFWTYQCDEQCTDIFAVQDSISEKIAGALALKLTGEERILLAKRYTQNMEAYQLYIRGRFFWNKRTGEGLKKAIDYFQQAIERDPNYALAYAGLADSYNVLVSLSLIPPQEAYARVEAAATEALKIDDTLAEAHASLAWLRFEKWDWPGAEKAFKRAIELNPNYATAHQWYAEYLTAQGRFDEAIAEVRQAQQIEPASLIINAILAQTYLYARQYDEAIEQCRRTLEMDPNFELTHEYLGRAYTQKGMYEEAIAEFKKETHLGRQKSLAEMGITYANSGNRGEALKALDELNALSKRMSFSPYSVAGIYAGLGEKNQAFKWLQRSYDGHEVWLTWLKVDPALDSLRSDPRFADLMRRVGLAP